MKIFQTIRKNFVAIGFKANDTAIVNGHNIRITVISSLAIASQIAYVLNEVNRIEEYMRSFVMIAAGIGIFVSFLATVFRKTELNDLIDKCQAVTSKSKQATFVQKRKIPSNVHLCFSIKESSVKNEMR